MIDHAQEAEAAGSICQRRRKQKAVSYTVGFMNTVYIRTRVIMIIALFKMIYHFHYIKREICNI